MTGDPHRHLVIASNLHVGGGVQVAASFVDEVARLAASGEYPDAARSTRFEVSTEVARELRDDTTALLAIDVVDRRPSRFGNALRDRRSRHESVLVVFGPLYSFPRATRRVMGYADVTSIYPPPIPAAESASGRAKRALRSAISRFEAARADVLVVETEAMRDRLREVLGRRAPEIEVVPNTINARVLDAAPDQSLTDRLAATRAEGVDLLLAFPTRAYPHKNLELLPRVRTALAGRGVEARFVVTLRPDEWAALGDAFRAACVNLGEVSIGQVATVVCASDGVFFPSLLEAYSATPIEAMALGVPLYASDRDFVRATCGDAAIYFDPEDADAAAEAILAARAEPADRVTARLRAGQDRVRALPTATDRARAYLALLGLRAEVAG